MQFNRLLTKSEMTPVCLLALAETCLLQLVECEPNQYAVRHRKAKYLLGEIQTLSTYYGGNFPPDWYAEVERCYVNIEQHLNALSKKINGKKGVKK